MSDRRENRETRLISFVFTDLITATDSSSPHGQTTQDDDDHHGGPLQVLSPGVEEE